jgi:hypothetical protein
MPRVWPIIYVLVFCAGVFLGYFTVAPERIRPVHPSIVSGCIFTFALSFISILVGFRYASAKVGQFRLPSFSRRFPWFWWDDPLQAWFGYSLLTFGLVLGSSHALISWDQNALWMLVWFSCLFSGLVVAQIVGYIIYRDRIQKA